MADSWPTCDQDACSGARIGDETRCLAHVGAEERGATLKRFSEGGELDVRGVTISDALFGEIYDAAPHDADGHRTFSAAWFDGATFEGEARFNEATFKGAAKFTRATFKSDPSFDQAALEGNAWFDGASFKSQASFNAAGFKSHASFDGASFEDNASFGGAAFEGNASFDGASFKGNAWFDGASFKGNASFDVSFKSDASFGGAAFKSDASFDQASFEGNASFIGASFKSHASFDEAAFEGNARNSFSGASFGTAIFEGNASFFGASFKSDASFSRATFKSDARFTRATFKGSDPSFDEATFEGNARFDGASFEGNGSFSWATFKSDASFDQASFEWNASFDAASFEGNASFVWAAFKSDASFSKAAFKNDASFSRATFKSDASFDAATFKGDVPVLGPIAVGRTLDLDGVQFASPVRIEADANVLTCRRGRFPGGVRFNVRHALVRLDDSDLSLPSLLAGPPASGPAGITEQPRLLSLQLANVAGLTVGNVDLADCRFAEAHNLDELRLEAGAVFGLSPAVAAWERRQVIAEEAAWRAARARPGRWKLPPWPDFDDEPEVLSPGAVAVLYRALRKSREDAKDEPGAADFYYGEMEMRRHDRGAGAANKWRGRASRIVLTAYWLVSGYGLRAWRSLAALAAVMAVSAAVFRLWGFTHSISYWKSLLFAFRSTLSLTDAQVTLTAWGGLFQAILRLTGPVLLALTLLALRGRVKR